MNRLGFLGRIGRGVAVAVAVPIARAVTPAATSLAVVQGEAMVMRQATFIGKSASSGSSAAYSMTATLDGPMLKAAQGFEHLGGEPVLFSEIRGNQ